jgi:DNA-binding NarL/FixJ family response regulator
MREGNWFAPLTRREADVAVLIRDMTNKEIAERLVLSERTIDNHVQNIMNKLNLHHRAQIASWVTERNTTKGPIVGDVEMPAPRRPRDNRPPPPKP